MSKSSGSFIVKFGSLIFWIIIFMIISYNISFLFHFDSWKIYKDDVSIYLAIFSFVLPFLLWIINSFRRPKV